MCVVSSYSFDLSEGESVESGVEYFVSTIHKFAKGQPCPTSSGSSLELQLTNSLYEDVIIWLQKKVTHII